MKRRRQIFFGTDREAARFSRAVAAGSLVRLTRGVFSDDTDTPIEQQVREHLWQLTAHFVPDALVADRSAAHYGRLTADGLLFVVSNRRRDLVLPGVRVVPRDGPERRKDDLPWFDGLSSTSPARTLVDNLAPSRARSGTARTLNRSELEEWVVAQAQNLPVERLNRLRDQAKQIAVAFGVEERIDEIDELMGAVQGTRKVRAVSPLMQARAARLDWDTRRAAQFEALADDLMVRNADGMGDLIDVTSTPDATRMREQPFFEAYFSNFIEGTEFTLDEAVRIVYDAEPLESRPEDSHDVLGTYTCIVDPDDAGHVANNAQEFVELLRHRHHRIMAERPSKHPGEFKREANRAGSYVFVQPDVVEGTLRRGFDVLAGLTDPFDRAVFAMFLVSEVHPFDDGNGRVARLAMNAELTAAGRIRIIVPTVFRTEYQTALRQLSRERRTELFVRTLNTAWRWSAEMDFSDQQIARYWLDLTNAMTDSTDAERTGVRLLLPSDVAISPAAT